MSAKPEAATFLGAGEVPQQFLRPKPAKLVCVDGHIIADAVVIVSHNDPNWFRPTGYKAYLTDDVVTVRRT
jgi:hypothetical protein